MIASLFVIFEIPFQNIREKEELQYGKHDKQLDQNDPPQLLSPSHVSETLRIEPYNFLDHCADKSTFLKNEI